MNAWKHRWPSANHSTAVMLPFVFLILTSFGQEQGQNAAIPPIVTLSHVSIAEVEVKHSELRYAYTQGGEDGLYASSLKVIDVVAGERAHIGRSFTTRPYSTTLRASRHAFAWAVSPPFQPGERMVLPLVELDGGLAWRWWDYVRPGRPPVARPGTQTHTEDLQLMNDLAAVLDAKPNKQWKMLRDYGTGSNEALAVWATAVVIDELEVQETDAEHASLAGRQLAQNTVEVIADKGGGNSFAVLKTLAQRLPRVPDVAGSWQRALMALAKRRYDDETEALSALEIAKLSCQARVSENARVQAIGAYVAALRNSSIPLAFRVGQASSLAEYLDNRIETSKVVEFVLELVLQGDTGDVRVAAAESLKTGPSLQPKDIAAIIAAYIEVKDKRVRDVLDTILESPER